MDPEATGRAYDQIAERWQDGAFDTTRGIAAHKRALRFVQSGKVALDVGCGCSSRINRLLHEHGLVVEGIDVSQRMIEIARATMPTQTFYHGDICTWQLPKAYDLITAWESLMHLPLAEVIGVQSKLLTGLQPNGVLLLTCASINEPVEFSNSAMGPEVYCSEIGLPAILSVIAQHSCTLKHLEIYADPQGAFVVIQAPTLDV